MMSDLQPEGVVEPEPNDPDPAADVIRPDRPRIWPEEPRAPKPQIKRPLEDWLVEWDDRVQKNDGRISQPNRRRRPRGLDRLIPINTRPERPPASEVPARGGGGSGGGGRRRRRGGGGGGGGGTGNAAAGTSAGSQTQHQPRSGQRQRGQQPGRQGQGQQQQPRGNQQQPRPPRQMGQTRRGPEGGQDRRPPPTPPPASDGSPGSRPPQGQGDPNRRRRRRGRGRGPRPNGPPRADGPSSPGAPPPA